MDIETLIKKNDPSSFALSTREICFLSGLPLNKCWKLLRTCEKYKIVLRSTSKISSNGSVIIFWKIIDKESFLKELKRRLA